MYKMAILSEIKSHSDVINYFKKLPLYNKPIEKPIKRLKNIDLLVELPFHEQLSVIKTDQAFKGYAISYKVEIIEKKDQILQLQQSKKVLYKKVKNEISDSSKNIFQEAKGFTYQITPEVLF